MKHQSGSKSGIFIGLDSLDTFKQTGLIFYSQNMDTEMRGGNLVVESVVNTYPSLTQPWCILTFFTEIMQVFIQGEYVYSSSYRQIMNNGEGD